MKLGSPVCTMSAGRISSVAVSTRTSGRGRPWRSTVGSGQSRVGAPGRLQRPRMGREVPERGKRGTRAQDRVLRAGRHADHVLGQGPGDPARLGGPLGADHAAQLAVTQLRLQRVDQTHHHAQALASIQRTKQIQKNLKATVIIQHDPRDLGKLPAFPAAAKLPPAAGSGPARAVALTGSKASFASIIFDQAHFTRAHTRHFGITPEARRRAGRS